MQVRRYIKQFAVLVLAILLISPVLAQETKKGQFTKVELKDKPLVLVAGQQYDFEKLEIKAEWKEKGTGNYFDQATGLDWLQNTSFFSAQDWTGLEFRDSGWLPKEGAFERKYESKYNQKKLQPDRAGSPAAWMTGAIVVKLDLVDELPAVVATYWFRFDPDDTVQTAEEIKRETKYEIKGVTDTTAALATAAETKVEAKLENKKPKGKLLAPAATGDYTFVATFLQDDSITVIGSGTVPFKVLSEAEIAATTGLQVLITLDRENYMPGATVTANVALADQAGNPLTDIHDAFIKKLEFWMSGPSKDYQALVQENKVVNEMAWQVADSTLPYTFSFTLPGNAIFGTYSFVGWAERLWERGYEVSVRADLTVGGVPTEPQVKCSNCHVADVVPKFEMGTDVGTTCLSCHTDQFLVGGGPWNLFGHKQHFEKGFQVRSCSSCHTFDVATEASWATCTSCHGANVKGELIAPAPPVWHNAEMACTNSTCHGPGAELSPDVVHERGEIIAIADVPNDQGKQVEVLWRKFPAENDVNNAVVKYAIWRRSEAPATFASATSLDGLLDKFASYKLGDQILSTEGEAWTFAGEVPAAGLDTYSAITPTLYDSSLVDGQHWSVFFVSGHTEVGNLVYRTEPDSGYSIDNLAPAAPSSLTAKVAEGGIILGWDDPVDEDFNYFSVYRAEAPGVELTEDNLLATLTETSFTDTEMEVGKTFYYTVTATDFSGNQGKPADEISVVITGVKEGTTKGLPDHYALGQNYPNPFNPSTTIDFSVKEPGHVTLAVFNALGEEIMRVIDRDMKPGYHRAVIRSQNLASGIYFYQLRVNNFAAVRKMAVMR